MMIEGNNILNTDNVQIAQIKPVAPTIYFKGNDNTEILRLEPNGDIFVHERLVENDRQVTDGLRYFLKSHGY